METLIHWDSCSFKNFQIKYKFQLIKKKRNREIYVYAELPAFTFGMEHLIHLDNIKLLKKHETLT